VNPIEVRCSPELRFLRPAIVQNLERIGNYGDGGYAIPSSAIRNCVHLFSLGLGENWSFEKSASRINPSLIIDVYDHTVSMNYFMKKVLKGLVKFIFFKESKVDLIARCNRLQDYNFFWRKNPRNYHHRLQISESSFRKLLLECPSNLLLGLKIDIEGSEWQILDLIVANQTRFEFFLLEVHDFDLHVDQLREFLTQISDRFVLAHLHANNFENLGSNGFPRVFEITLLKSPGATNPAGYRSELPIPGLDVPNAKNRPDFLIKFQ
jgi:hypothetical protein